MFSPPEKEKRDYPCASRMNKGNVRLHTVVESHGWQMSQVSRWRGSESGRDGRVDDELRSAEMGGWAFQDGEKN